MSCRTCACRGNCNYNQRRARSDQSNNSLRLKRDSSSASSPRSNTNNNTNNYNTKRTPVKNNNQKRASSAGKTETTSSTKLLSLSSSKKVAASDSKLTQTNRNAKTQKHQDLYVDTSDSESSPHSLKEDLKAIKEQLKILTDNKNEALGITNELHERYKLLVSKNEQQEKEIEALKNEKRKLLKRVQAQPGNQEKTSSIALRKNSDRNGEKSIGVPYSEFLDSSKAIEQTLEKVCQCMREKSEDLGHLQEKERRLSKTIESKDAELSQLRKELEEKERRVSISAENRDAELQQFKRQVEEKERRLLKTVESKDAELSKLKRQLDEKDRRLSQSHDNKDSEIAQLRRKLEEMASDKNKSEQKLGVLSESCVQLQNRLNEALENLGKFQNLELASRTRENNLKQQIMVYAKKLEEKSIVMGKMSATVEELKQHVCECNKKTDQVDLLQQKYHALQVEHNNLIKKFRQNEANDVRRYNQNVQMMKAMQDRERQLVEENQKLKNIVTRLSRVAHENEETIEKISCLCDEKDFVIQSQMKELDAKDKQVNLVSSSFMNRKQCGETNSGSKGIGQNESRVCTTGDSTPKLSEELEKLIAALYAEIEKSLENEQMIRDQFRNICCLKRILVSKQHEVCCVQFELASVKKKLSESVQQNELLLEELKIIEAQNRSSANQEEVLGCYADCAELSDYEPTESCDVYRK